VQKVTDIVSSVSRKGGGLFYSVRRLAQSVAELGALEGGVVGLEDEFSREDVDQWRPLKPKLYPVSGPKRLGYSPGLMQGTLNSDASLLHGHGIWMYPSRVTYEWWRQKGRPYLISPHGMLEPWTLKHSTWKKAVAKLLYENANLHHASCFRSLCESESHSIRRLGLNQPICQIPNGVDIPGGEATGAAPWSRQLKDSDDVLLYLGRIHPKKGLANLVKAFAELQAGGDPRWSSWYLVIAGWDQDDHEEKLKTLARSLRMESRILFPGPIFNREKAAAFSKASAFVLPSFSEGLPIAVLEAWSHALPVLMTQECNLPEGFARGAAFQVHNDPKRLRDGLQAFFSMKKGARQEMGAKGRDLVVQKFSWSKVAEEMLEVYLWLLGSRPRPRSVIA